METITTTRPYVEHPMHIDTMQEKEAERYVLAATAEAFVRANFAMGDDDSEYLFTPAEARAIAAGLLVIADEAEERQAVLDAAAPVPWPGRLTVAELKQDCADMEARIGRSEKGQGIDEGEAQHAARKACGIDVGADILASRMKRPGALAYHTALRALTWTCSKCSRVQIAESPKCHECHTVR